MDLMQKIKQKAGQEIRTIILPEGDDPRIKEAAQVVNDEGFAKVVLLDKKSLDQKKVKEYASLFHDMRKHKGISEQEALDAVSDPLYYATMMIKEGEADGFVAGAANATANVARAGFYCLGLDKRLSVMTSTFIMVIPDCPFGENGVLLFSDCAIIPDPSARQLASIAVSTAELAQKLFDIKPRVAMLSYSTKGSASGRYIEKVQEATKLAKNLSPELLIDGELQADTAIVPEIAKKKDPEGLIQGKANVLIFPTLDSGNISYKLVQRMTGAKAIGPILLGLNAPCSDLSRGCSVSEIVDCVAICAVRAQKEK
ncbi:phosphate acetyltransferase [Thermoproteota archaeon]